MDDLDKSFHDLLWKINKKQWEFGVIGSCQLITKELKLHMIWFEKMKEMLIRVGWH
jgi:hypothetical protein